MNLRFSLRSLFIFISPVFSGLPEIEPSNSEWDLSMPMNGFAFERARATSPPTVDRVSPRFSRLRKLKGNSRVQGHLGVSSLERAGIAIPGKSQNISTIGGFSTQYALQCGWDDTLVWLLFDTGSSDTWAVQSGFSCQDNLGNKHKKSACAFGEPYIDEFKHGEVEGVHFYLSYASGEEVSGPMGRSDLLCGGLFVSEQQVGLANKTYWHGNNVTVGILGLAYPSITSAYYGQVGEEQPWLMIPYTPFLTRAISQGTIEPIFSVTIMRNSSDGILTWGGVPPMSWNRKSKAVTDIIIANLIDQEGTAWKYSFYTIIPDGVVWGLTSDTTKYPYIVDTATTMMHLPPLLAEAIADAFEPRATYIYQWGSYFVPCDAIAPRFAVVISGVEFWINRADLIYQDLVDPMTGLCACGITSGGPGPYILGDVFLQNVLAVFDIGAAEMRFYSKD
ncbi:aspartic peptidase domain-containing protein [Dactylonectria macrodidyma]|uniref:Aspartic peptidase domain-containing protein n=1 Tax=Dactylonectria macrodidyma TaxID=307937 RepID=A0A9P9JCR6_9HYPO|nr:aspartic peptidase domain-containing protein [Dactylonectria macrodidyma]